MNQERQRLWSSASAARASCPGYPASALWRFAGVNVHHFQAVLAAHSTTPVEFALTFCHPADAGGVVASPAAHHFTAVHATGGLVTHPASCPKGPCKGNAAKVRRRVLRKDSKHMKIGIGDLICKVFDPLISHHPGFNIKPEKCL